MRLLVTRLAETTRKLGKLFRSEQQHDDDKNEESFRPTWHAEGDWDVH